MIYWITWVLTRVAMRLLLRIRFVGAHHMPRQGPVLIASNHVSYLDPPVIAIGLGRRLRFIAKVELLRPAIMGWFLRKLSAIPVRRGEADRRAIQEAIKTLREGGVVAIFPEGTRSETGDLQEPEMGAGMLTLRTGAPVLPVYVSGTEKALPQGGKFRPAPVCVHYGAPLVFSVEDGRKPRRADYERVARAIMTAIQQLRDEAAAAADGQ